MHPHDTPEFTPNKQCSKCKKWKPGTAEFFNRDKDRPSGLDPQCKACKKAYYQKNQQRLKDKANENYKTRREAKLKYAASYRLANRGKIEEWRRIFQATQGERIRAAQRTDYASDKTRYVSYRQRRRARKRNAEGTHTGNDIKHQYKAQKGKCYYCGKKVGDTYHVDHVFPLSRGGSNGPENIVIACPFCNQSKNDKMPHEWPEGGRLL